MKITLGRTIYSFAFVTPIMVAALAFGETSNNVIIPVDNNLKTIPVDLSIECLKGGSIVLKVSNPTKKEQRLASNLVRALDYKTFDFPYVAALQFRNAKKEQIEMICSQGEGWWYPCSVSSHALSAEEVFEMYEMSDIIVHRGGVLRYPIKLDKAFTMAKACRLNKTNELEFTEFRMMLPMLAFSASGETVRVAITSEWFLVSADFR